MSYSSAHKIYIEMKESRVYSGYYIANNFINRFFLNNYDCCRVDLLKQLEHSFGLAR